MHMVLVQTTGLLTNKLTLVPTNTIFKTLKVVTFTSGVQIVLLTTLQSLLVMVVTSKLLHQVKMSKVVTSTTTLLVSTSA